MKEFFGNNLFLATSLIVLLLIGLYREWEEKRLYKEIERIFCKRKLDNGKRFSIRQLDLFIYYIIQRLFNYVFRGFVTRQILNQYIIFPLIIVISLFLLSRNDINKDTSQNLILLITFVAIIWYSKETFALREEQKNANDIAIGRPLIIIAKELGNFIGIKNYGNNIAKHISIKFIHKGILLKEIQYNVLNHTQKLVKYPIDENISAIIDSVDKDFITEIKYYNFQSRRRYITTFELDDSILVDSRVGRFKIKEDY